MDCVLTPLLNLKNSDMRPAERFGLRAGGRADTAAPARAAAPPPRAPPATKPGRGAWPGAGQGAKRTDMPRRFLLSLEIKKII